MRRGAGARVGGGIHTGVGGEELCSLVLAELHDLSPGVAGLAPGLDQELCLVVPCLSRGGVCVVETVTTTFRSGRLARDPRRWRRSACAFHAYAGVSRLDATLKEEKGRVTVSRSNTSGRCG